MYERGPLVAQEEFTQPRQATIASPGTPVREYPPCGPKIAANIPAGMLENNRITRPKRTLDLLVSRMAYALLVGVAILLPLWFSKGM